MQRIIAWLLQRYTPFRVLAWGPNGKIAGIGYSNIAANLAGHGMVAESGVAQMRAQQFEAAMKLDAEGNSAALGRRQGHSALRVDKETGELETFGPHPPKPWPLDRRSAKR